MTTWGIVSTVRGSAQEILRFAAYHLDLGADTLYLFLDEPNDTALSSLRLHPKIKALVCDDAYWDSRRRKRPEKHQVRQTDNATFTYRNTDLDWLAHIDIDEFLWPLTPIADLLAAVPPEVPAVRTRPLEALAGGEDLYKAFIPAGPDRAALVQSIYPNYGEFVRGGFFSHLQGKLFARTGLPKLSYRIHNLYQFRQPLPCDTELPQVDLCHRHAPDWDHWLAHYQFRLARGSYQADMAPNVPRESGGLNMHELLSGIEEDGGEAGLRKFYDEISGANPDVRTRLEDLGMIRHRPLNLDRKVAKHFPESV